MDMEVTLGTTVEGEIKDMDKEIHKEVVEGSTYGERTHVQEEVDQ